MREEEVFMCKIEATRRVFLERSGAKLEKVNIGKIITELIKQKYLLIYR